MDQTQAIIPAPAAQQPAALEPPPPTAGASISAFASQGNFQAAQRMAMALSKSSIVPTAYRGEAGLPNCLVALELSSRIGASILMVMQSLHIIQGRPSFSSSFLIATVNSCGRFTPIRYEWRGAPGAADWACRAVAKDKVSGERLEGAWISWEMARKEGWSTKKDSKWATMPEQMFMYRAAGFWTRVYAPELAMGLGTTEEARDMHGVEPLIEVSPAPSYHQAQPPETLEAILEAEEAPDDSTRTPGDEG